MPMMLRKIIRNKGLLVLDVYSLRGILLCVCIYIYIYIYIRRFVFIVVYFCVFALYNKEVFALLYQYITYACCCFGSKSSNIPCSTEDNSLKRRNNGGRVSCFISQNTFQCLWSIVEAVTVIV